MNEDVSYVFAIRLCLFWYQISMYVSICIAFIHALCAYMHVCIYEEMLDCLTIYIWYQGI